MEDAIVLIPTPCRDSQIDVGSSKFGGNPDLPEDFQLDFDFKYFVGQINFAQMLPREATTLLPAEGLLSLFLNIAQDGSYTARAKYFTSLGRLQRILLPPSKHPCHPCRLKPSLFESIPTTLPLSNEYLQYEQAFRRRFYPHRQNLDFDTPWHQMLSFHRNTAGILLLQIDSDSLVSMNWGYCGKLFFWIDRSDLVDKNFSAIQVELVETKS